MVHADGDVLLRHDSDGGPFEVYKGSGIWGPDRGGPGTWSGRSSDAGWYSEVSEEETPKIMKNIDAIHAKHAAPATENPPHQGGKKFHHVTELLANSGEKPHFFKMIDARLGQKPSDPVGCEAWEAGIFSLLDELTEVLRTKIGTKTSTNEINAVIRVWIDQKISEAT